ncbi:hypothetical protein Bca4012_048725 [Brassica carinata]|uniref:Uncharacterized protein n=1 Tax=Brassica carinata TaxID=52824 RepID=A0A8X7R4T7_BRACI|nr:hypothetical protein Bca52824_051625 [Brassica carinata]
MDHGTTYNTMGQSPNKEYPLKKKRHAAHHVSDRRAINEHASERAPSASTGTREGRVGSPPTAKSKQRKLFNQNGLHEARTEETVWQICETKKIQQPSTIDRNPLTILKTQTDIFIDTNKLEDATSQKQLGKKPSEKRSRGSEQKKTGDADLDGIGINPEDSRRDRCWRSHRLPETKAGEACKRKHGFPETRARQRGSQNPVNTGDSFVSISSL